MKLYCIFAVCKIWRNSTYLCNNSQSKNWSSSFWITNAHTRIANTIKIWTLDPADRSLGYLCMPMQFITGGWKWSKKGRCKKNASLAVWKQSRLRCSSSSQSYPISFKPSQRWPFDIITKLDVQVTRYGDWQNDEELSISQCSLGPI